MEERPFLLLSFPRQGTDFVMSCIQQACPAMKYAREFFNPICTPGRYRDAIAREFGDEDSFVNIFKVPDLDAVRSIVRNTFLESGFDATKENFSFLKVPALVESFRVTCLYRKRENTFPTSRTQFILPIFESFMQNFPRGGSALDDALDADLSRVRAWISEQSLDDNQKCVIAHIVSWYVQLHQCRLFEIPVLEYSTILRAPEDELRAHVARALPFDASRLARIMVQRRRNPRNCGDAFPESVCVVVQGILDRFADQEIADVLRRQDGFEILLKTN